MQNSLKSIKNEFFDLIATSFNKEQVDRVRELARMLEGIELTEEDKISMYYNACSLFYRCCKDYAHFIVNFRLMNKSMLTTLSHIKKSYEEHENVECYEQCRKIIKTALRKSYQGDDIVFALTNAIVPEILQWNKIEKAINEARYSIEIQKVNKLLSQGKEISNIVIFVRNQKVTNLECGLLNNNLWDDFATFSSHSLLTPNITPKRLKELEDVNSKLERRIVHRIAIVFVKYGILKPAAKDNNYQVKSLEGKSISMKNETLLMVYKIVDDLGKEYGRRKEGWHGIIKLKNSDNGYNEIKIENEKYGHIKSILKSRPDDAFSYDDINENYLGCIMDEYKKED